MHAWTFAYRRARESEWMRYAADRYRFELRKQQMEAMLTEIGFFASSSSRPRPGKVDE